jgi:hypothetical protein
VPGEWAKKVGHAFRDGRYALGDVISVADPAMSPNGEAYTVTGFYPEHSANPNGYWVEDSEGDYKVPFEKARPEGTVFVKPPRPMKVAEGDFPKVGSQL